MKNFTVSNNLKNQLIYNIVDFLEKVSKVEDGKLCIPYPEDAFYEEDCPICTSFFTKDKGKKTKWTFYYGATKMVFVPNHYNFVIKIPFNCGGEFLYDGDDIAGCYVNRILFPYERANNDKDDWNYCKVEEKLYKKAIENNVEKFFAGTYFFKNIKVNEEIYPIYISEKVEQNNGILYDTYQSNEEECNKMYRHYKANTKYECWGVSDEALLLLSKKYRESEIWRLLEFIRNFGITDLTNRNCGFTSDGRLVILDYSGYNEIDDYYDDYYECEEEEYEEYEEEEE